LGSTLVSAGTLDKSKFPTTQVIVKNNLVCVVADTEWEAVRASQQVAATTKWTDWKGLPGDAGLFKAMRAANWTAGEITKGEKEKGDAGPGLASAAKRFTASYEVPYMKHGSMGPTIAVADVRPDGMVFIYTHNQAANILRTQIAQMLGTSVD